MAGRVEARARVERKDASLPRYLVLPADAARTLALEATTPAEFTLAGTDIGRRNIKRWSTDSELWFVDLTEAQCTRAGVDTGDEVAVVITRVADAPPEELQALLKADAAARTAWAQLSTARRRALVDHVREAKRAETRQRRAASVLRSLGEQA